MKKILLSILFLTLFLLGSSQDSLRTKLLEVYSVENTNAITSNCQQKNYYSNLIFHSYRITNLQKIKKGNTATILNSVKYKNIDGTFSKLTPEKVIEMIDNGSFNILRAAIPRKLKQSTSFILGKTKKIITLFSQEQINSLTKKQKC